MNITMCSHMKDLRPFMHRALKGGNSTLCTYCRLEREDELHLYVECDILRDFWLQAKNWFMNNFGVVPILTLRAYRLFGMEKEPPNDL